MGWFGKIVGGGLGFSIAGPVGALLGTALGHVFDTSEAGLRPSATAPSATEQQQAVFFVSTFALLGKMAKADGVVTADEIQAVERYLDRLGLDETRRRLARRIFSEAKESPVSHVDYARSFASAFASSHELKVGLLDILREVAQADGRVHPSEARILADVADSLGVPRPVSGRATPSAEPDDLGRHYAVLGADPSDDWSTIKQKYREIAQKFHPDRLVSKGLPEEFSAFATRKLQEANAAFEAVRAARGR
jgi:DnaJ like chaperone protein